jgi:hypothetical protein
MPPILPERYRAMAPWGLGDAGRGDSLEVVSPQAAVGERMERPQRLRARRARALEEVSGPVSA